MTPYFEKYRTLERFWADARQQREIARDYGVTQSLISMIKNNVIWKSEVAPCQ